ncbi:MAG: PadR family transcriptional regulator [Pseudomonadales bacterium]|nr:PadR family transcriptional regulator [Anaerolineales bacterium]MCB8917129.1 PadR family transcriptional regulator [Ardenticatenaceae bacterium]MCP5190560.1 PadR family transcriptional regulator [Pseudomonadales bacterium]
MERELLLLGLLRQEGMHGYQLHDFIESFMQTCVDLKKSTAYYLLDKLAQAGLVDQTEEREGNRPVRRVYHLTPAGEAMYQQLLRENLSGYQPARFAGNVGLTFLDDLPAGEAIYHLQQRRTQLAAALSQAQQAPRHKGSLQLIIEHQIMHLQAELTWLDSLVSRLETSDHGALTGSG